MTRAQIGMRCGQVGAISVWIAGYMDPDTYALAGTVAGSVMLLVVCTELAYRVMLRW